MAKTPRSASAEDVATPDAADEAAPEAAQADVQNASPEPEAAAPAEQAVAAEPPQTFPTSLDEFCAALSAQRTRVELISAFHREELAAGRLRDLAATFRARFDAFARRPA